MHPLVPLGLAFEALVVREAPPLPLPPRPPASLEVLSAHLADPLAAHAALADPAARFHVRVELDPAPEGAGTDGATARLAPRLAEGVALALAAGGASAAPGGDDAPLGISILVALSGDRVVHARARLVRRPANVWERLRLPEGELLGTSGASAPLDLELRLLLGLDPRRVRLDRLRLRDLGAKSDAAVRARPVLDALVADLDADGLPEVLLLQPDRVLVARFDAGSLRLVSLDPLRAPPNVRGRVRPPLGRIVPLVLDDGSAAVVVASTDRARPEIRALAPGLPALETGDLEPLWPLYASGGGRWLAVPWPSGTGILEGDVVEVGWAVGAAATAEPVSTIDPAWDLRAFGVFSLASPAWNPHVVTAAVDGGVSVVSAAAVDAPVAFPAGGTAALVDDLDRDGSAEVFVTGAAVRGPDRIDVYELVATGAEPGRKRSQRVPDPVTALAAGDLDADGFREVLVLSWAGDAGGVHVLAPREP